MIALGRSHETSIIREGENLNIEDYGFAPNAWHSENGGFPVKGAGPWAGGLAPLCYRKAVLCRGTFAFPCAHSPNTEKHNGGTQELNRGKALTPKEHTGQNRDHRC